MVRPRQVQRGDGGWRKPGQGDMFAGAWFGAFGKEAADEGDHLDDLLFVMVAVAGQGTQDGDFAAKFLLGLAGQRGLGWFAGFDFSPGKFPFEGEMLVRRPLRDQEAAPAFDEGTDNRDGGGQVGHGGGMNVESGKSGQAGLRTAPKMEE